MNDLDDLRDAMHSTPGFEPKPLDIAAVMTAGGRLRRRRRAAVGAASGLTVLALLVGGFQLVRPEGSPAPDVAAAGQPSGAAPAKTADPSATAVEENPDEPITSTPFGDVVDTGIKVGGLDRLLWMQRVDEPELPDTTFGIATGWRTTAGEFVVDIVNNEVEGSDRAPGFHALQMAMVVNDNPTPAFGYYVGDAAKITVVANGRTVRAEQAVWSEDRSIVLFWFPLNKVKPASRVGQATAYDDNGRKLPAGNATFGVG
ncbi:hypothetical protein [Actinoplanes auranticolor]|uniref:Uncharacterized protein n=1 Tax=Actinoplanes auranticolor TaxID=47988 RepID=A0A919S9V7_9ACTN|nr:hypothetical protein [Actinoplanes auranticolor]GIM67484.1 hypothetical protein Aau02nite_27450 [Actinoplanes auranticolor]